MRDLKQALVFIIVLQSYVSSKVLFVSEVWRHGPRTPSVTFNLTVEPYHDLGNK